jgi:hypothetical protein
MKEAENSTRQLYALVKQVLESNQDLAARLKRLEREGSIHSDAASRIEPRDDSPIIRQTTVSTRFPSLETDRDALCFTFEQDLAASRVYNKDINRHSLSSLTSTALYMTALSIFSKLSLSQVSNVSFYALPVYAFDLSNSEYYVFGKEGVGQGEVRDGNSRDEVPENAPVAQRSGSATSELAPLKRQGPGRLLGRFALRRKKPVITPPQNPLHITHVSIDNETGEFTVRILFDSGIVNPLICAQGLPITWQRSLEELILVSRSFRSDQQTLSSPSTCSAIDPSSSSRENEPVPPRRMRMPSPNTTSPSNASVEPFKSLKVSIDDPCYKVLQVALKKHNINAPWNQYSLYIVYDDQERRIGLDEKPLMLTKQLEKENKKPVFILRKDNNAQVVVSGNGPGKAGLGTAVALEAVTGRDPPGDII